MSSFYSITFNDQHLIYNHITINLYITIKADAILYLASASFVGCGILSIAKYVLYVYMANFSMLLEGSVKYLHNFRYN